MMLSASSGRGVGAAGYVDDGQVCENPESQRDAEDDCSGLAKEDAAAVHQAHTERAESGHGGTGEARG